MQRLFLYVLSIAALGGTTACSAGQEPSSTAQAPATPSNNTGPSPRPDSARPAPSPTSNQTPTQPPMAAPPAEQKPTTDEPAASAYAASRGRSVQWKRNAAFEADLMRGLDLTRDEVCQELGAQSCIHEVHTVALGGNDPFGSGLLRPAASSLSTTPLAVDRITLSACSQRARADKQGSPKVFTALDLSGPAPAPDAEAVTQTITTLFQRLLARDPKPSELTTLADLLAGDTESMTAEEFATLSCFVVASSIEALFF
jgi:hypothetical protein